MTGERSRSAAGPGGPGDAVLFAVLAAAGSIAGGVWAWGGVAGVVFGDGWPHVTTGQLARVL
ncbi:MAG: hypothetical protein M3022_15470, partial [Actinomycetota bacterium]|nr:hypothetical protein [Actinomycetota bacterium]